MKILTAFSLIILMVFAGCTSVEYQKMQNERERLRAAYEEARIKNDRQTVKNSLAREVLGTWQFLNIEVLESDMSNEVESAAAALIKTSRKNLTIRFFEHNGIRFYEGNNISTNVSGKFAIKVDRIAEVLYPKIRLDQGSGITPGEFLFNSAGIFSGPPEISNVLISVQENRLYLTLGAGVSTTPTPEGWAQSDGIRYSFKRIK